MRGADYEAGIPWSLSSGKRSGWVSQTHVEVSSMQPVAKVMRVEAVGDDRYRKASTEDHGGQEENQDSTVPGAKCKMMSEKKDKPCMPKAG